MNGRYTQNAAQKVCIKPTHIHPHVLQFHAGSANRICKGTNTYVLIAIAKSAIPNSIGPSPNILKMLVRRTVPVSFIFRSTAVSTMMDSPIQNNVKNPRKS